MRSMTGFGVATAPLCDGLLRLEIRALNHRHQELRIKMPSELGEHAFFLEGLARTALGRGRFDLHVRTEGRQLGAPRLSIERAKSLYAGLLALRDELAPGADVPFEALLRVPELFETVELPVDDVHTALRTALERALISLDEMRRTEGAALEAEIRERLSKIRDLVREVSGESKELVAHYRLRLLERVGKLLDKTGAALHPERLEQEIALLADRSDVTEELVRLESHFSQLDTLLGSDESVGRKLDFLLQEVGREVNTIGSKSPSHPVAHLVVDLKAEVEKLREQIQNVD